MTFFAARFASIEAALLDLQTPDSARTAARQQQHADESPLAALLAALQASHKATHAAVSGGAKVATDALLQAVDRTRAADVLRRACREAVHRLEQAGQTPDATDLPCATEQE